MENRRNHNSTVAPRMSEVFPQAVIADKFVFLSGTPGLIPATGKLGESFEEQTRQAFLNIKTILEEVGSGLEKIVKTRNFPHQCPGPEHPPGNALPCRHLSVCGMYCNFVTKLV